MVNTMEMVGNNRFHSDHIIRGLGIEFPRNILFGVHPFDCFRYLKEVCLRGFAILFSVKIVLDYRFVLYTRI